MTPDDPRKTAPVPSGRASRLWHLGRAAGGIAVAGAARGLSSLMRGERPRVEDLVLTPDDARHLADRLSRMRGAIMKLGQLLSLDGKDLLPPAFVELLAPLRDGAHVMPFSQLVGVLDREYGPDWNKRFRRFSFTPIAAASIGQVHRAETRDGRVLALKVQYPGVRESIDSDIDNLALLARIPGLVPEGLDLAPLLDQVRAQLRREADYAAEAQALTDFRARLGEDPRFSVPCPHEDLSTERVLAMDFADGEPVDRLAAPHVPQALRDRVAEALSGLVMRELFELGVVQTDPNFANYLHDAGTDRIHLLDFGAARPIEPELARAYARLARAAVREDRTAVREAAEALGYLTPEDRSEHVQGLVDLTVLAAEPIRHRGVYDFGASDLLGRANALGQDLVFRRGFARTPPSETLFLHRKFVGAYMLCARLGARFDARALVEPWLDDPALV